MVYGSYIIGKGGLKELVADARNHPKLIIGQSVLDNVAWLSFAIATTHIPIAIAMTISESYIALTVLLGLFVSREKLRIHQIVGAIFATISVIILSYISS